MRKALPGSRIVWKIAYVALSALLTLSAVIYFANLQASAAAPAANAVTVIQAAVVNNEDLGITVDNASETNSELAFDVTVGSDHLTDIPDPVKYYTSTSTASNSCRTSNALYESAATGSGGRYTVPVSDSVKTVCLSVYAKEIKRNRFHQPGFAYGYYAIAVNVAAAEPTSSETAVTTKETISTTRMVSLTVSKVRLGSSSVWHYNFQSGEEVLWSSSILADGERCQGEVSISWGSRYVSSHAQRVEAEDDGQRICIKMKNRADRTVRRTFLVVLPVVAPKIEARTFLGTTPPATLPSNIQVTANADQDIDSWSYIVVENSVNNDYSNTGTTNACERLFSLNTILQSRTWRASGFWSNRLATHSNSNGLVGNAGGNANRAILALNLSHQGRFVCVKAVNENGSDYVGRLLPTVSKLQPRVEVEEEVTEAIKDESEAVSATEQEDMGNDGSDSVENVENAEDEDEDEVGSTSFKEKEATVSQKDGADIQTEVEEDLSVAVSEEINVDSGNPSSEPEIASSEAAVIGASGETVSTTGGSGINWIRLIIYILVIGAVLAVIYTLVSKAYGQREN